MIEKNKVCSKCTKEKSVNDFPKNRTSKCRLCYNEHQRSVQSKRSRTEEKARYYLENKEKLDKRNSLWKKNNKAKVSASRAKYRAKLNSCTPSWLTSKHFLLIEEFYIEARSMSEKTGVMYQVDHIEPIQGKYSTGLHVPWNLQVLPHYENESKSNKLIV